MSGTTEGTCIQFLTTPFFITDISGALKALTSPVADVTHRLIDEK